MEAPFEATLPGTPSGVRTLRRAITHVARGCGMDEETVADVRLAVTEAATNAVMHGYARMTGELTVSAVVENGELAIVVGDTGGGFDEHKQSPGLGVGLSIIATVADRLKILTKAGRTEIHMAFPCPDGH